MYSRHFFQFIFWFWLVTKSEANEPAILNGKRKTLRGDHQNIEKTNKLSMTVSNTDQSYEKNQPSLVMEKLDSNHRVLSTHNADFWQGLIRPIIINGIDSQIGRYKYMVSLTNGLGSHVCGGSLIARDLVLTAAHCDGHFSKVQIGRYDTSNHLESYEVFNVIGKIRHENYDERFLINDIMVLRIDGLSSNPIVVLNEDEHVPEALTIIGWGAIESSGQLYRGPLQEASVRYIPNPECNQSSGYIDGVYGSYYGLIKDSMLCASAPGTDTCFGDSGGPLIIKGADESEDIQVGIVSWGFECAHPDFPGVYARVSDQASWIKSIICIVSNAVPSHITCPRRHRLPQYDSCTMRRSCKEGFECINERCIQVRDKNHARSRDSNIFD